MCWAPNLGRSSSLSKAEPAPTPGPHKEAKRSPSAFSNERGSETTLLDAERDELAAHGAGSLRR
eukprot:7276727-Pyramimonas_sp.AAC.1